MKHIKSINEFFYFFNDSKYKSLAKKFHLAYNEISKDVIKLGPKNGHEITITIDRDSCEVRPSYYGTAYKSASIVKDVEQYLKDYDFNSKPNITHKYNYHLKKQTAPKATRNKNEDDVFSIMTKELKDRTKGPTSMAHAYLLRFENSKELDKLKEKYPIGGEYKGEKITNTTTLRSKDIHFGN